MAIQPKILEISGTAIPLRGNDIDTDRIIPARFLKCIVFDELGPHAFEDDRKACLSHGEPHPFDNNKFKNASILFVNKNFGCGSSREHAPQALMRYGIKAIIGESFAEIFFGNCVSLGIPCGILAHEYLEQLITMTESRPGIIWTLDIKQEKLGCNLSGYMPLPILIPQGARNQFLTGTWNSLFGLLENKAEVNELAQSLPYL